MRRITIIVFLAISSMSHAYCQKLFVTLYNRTESRIRFSIIYYLNDSSSFSWSFKTGVESGLLFGGGKGGYIGFKHNTVIRTDIVAVNDSTNDTIFAKSYPKNGNKDEHLIVEIFAGDVNKLIKLYPSPSLEIKSNKVKYLIYKKQFVVFKLTNGKKVKGELISFNENNLTLNCKNQETITISKNELAKIRECGYHVYIGASIKLFPYCRFNKLTKVKFTIINYRLK